ncbi:thioredoxin domain-containing protein [Pantoea sp. ME81]|uniref:thioredoxin domain-containing protein n=1 Tax=Pantoea sp. ME81 TaxID=2743935 RepID=UPI0015F5C14E|nr:thioredoxin domain-containing protein [Pantoea sp. ME81]
MLKILIASMMLMTGSQAYPKPPADRPHHFLHVPLSELVAFTPERVPETEALIRRNLLNDPWSPRTGAKNPVLTLVCFTDYNSRPCRQLDVSLSRLIRSNPRIAVTYKFAPSPRQPTEAARMALTVWQFQPEKFEAFHHALMAYEGMIDGYSIRAAMRAADVHISRVSPDTLSPLAVNRSLIMKLSLTEIPSLLIGDKVMTGSAKYSELEGAVNAALKNS